MFLHDEVVDPGAVVASPAVVRFLTERRIVAIAPRDMRKRKLVEEDRLRLAWRKRKSDKRVTESVEWASRALCFDQSRVFIVGHGAGGFAAQRLSCARWLTALGTFGTPVPEAGPYGIGTCDPVRPQIWMHPVDSPVVPADGGNSCRAWPMSTLEDTEQKLFARHACDKPPERWPVSDGATCVRGECGTPLAFCRVPGGTTWPGLQRSFMQTATHGVDCSGDVAPDFDVLAEMWRFFESVPPL